MKKYTYSNSFFVFFGKGNEKDTYSNGFVNIFGFGTPGELARRGGQVKVRLGSQNQNNKKNISLCVFVSFLTNNTQKKQLEYVCFSNLHWFLVKHLLDFIRVQPGALQLIV